MIYRAARPAAGADDEKLLEWLGISRTPKKVLSEVTYFTCLKMLSETLAKMPIKFYQQTDRGVEEAETNKAYELLKTRPNPQMTPSTFWATVENNRNHYGNAYVWIRREFNRMMYGGEIEIKDLWIMPSADTTIVIDDTKEGVTAEEIDSLINAETWKNGKEWQEFFDIEVSEKSQATACKSEYFDKYNHLPDKLKEQPQQQINIDDLAERVAEKLKDATQPETPKVPENDEKQKTAEILEDLELI